MHINSLPDLVLRLIFSKLSLNDLVCIGRVCALWKSFQMSIGNQVRSLTLLFGSSSAASLITNSCFTLKYRDLLLNDDGTRMYSSQHLDMRFRQTYGSFKFDCVEELLNIFPRITTLEIAIIFVHEQFLLSSMMPLLTKWSPVLKSLKVYFQFKWAQMDSRFMFANETYEFLNLFEVINSMQSLKHLTFDTDTQIYPLSSSSSIYTSQLINQPRHLSIDLPIFGRLHELYFKSTDSLAIIEKSVYSYAVPNDNLKQIGLDLSNIVFQYLRYPQLSSKIVYLPSCVSAFYSTGVRNNMKSFSTITKLNLVPLIPTMIAHLTIDALNSISSFPQLTHLHLSSYNGNYFRLIQTIQHVPQLVTVQVLTISTELKSTSDFESNHWAHLFPNVQVIELTISTIFSLNTKPTSWNLSEQELQQILSNFVHCPKLHTIYTCEKYYPVIEGNDNLHTDVVKEWIILQVRDCRIVTQVEL